MSTELSMTINAELSHEGLQEISLEFAELLSSIQGIRATPATHSATENERSSAVGIIGQLALTVISHQVLNPLVRAMAAMLRRDKTLVLKLKNKQGRTLEVTSKNLNADDLRSMIDALSGLLNEG